MAEFADTHVHLHFEDFSGDRESVMDRARARGVKYFVNVGTDVVSSRQALEFARNHEGVYAAAGIHPHDAKDAGKGDLEALEEILRDPRVVAVGEVGLDFYRNLSPAAAQEELFRRFLGLHKKTGKPVIVHCREAQESLVRILHEEGGAPYRGVMHCFSGDTGAMKAYLEMGFHISFAGPLTYKKNETLREACRECPRDRLLVETDAPFLPPQSMRGKRNEPAYLVETAERMAELRGVPLEELGRAVTANARELFGL